MEGKAAFKSLQQSQRPCTQLYGSFHWPKKRNPKASKRGSFSSSLQFSLIISFIIKLANTIIRRKEESITPNLANERAMLWTHHRLLRMSTTHKDSYGSAASLH
jgi:hypothetical protein